MRISDWSSYVCSSDLLVPDLVEAALAGEQRGAAGHAEAEEHHAQQVHLEGRSPAPTGSLRHDRLGVSWSAGRGRLKRKPWPRVQPRRCRWAACSMVSMPSATTVRPSSLPRDRIGATIASSALSDPRPLTKERSTVSAWTGN